MNKQELTYLLLVSGLLAVSFPPFPLGFLVPGALVIFMYFLRDRSPADGFRLGYLLGLFWGAFTLFWIASSTLFGAVLAVAINALQYGIIWWLYVRFRRRSPAFALVSLPFLWVALEYLRQFSDLRFNWLTLSYTQTYYRSLIQIVDITGYLSLSFALVAVAALIYTAIEYRRNWFWISPLVIFLLIAGLEGYGQARIRHFEQKPLPLIRAALVQPNVDPYEKWDPEFQEEAFRMLLAASRRIAPERPDLIVWPETATPFFLRAKSEALEKIQAFLDSTHTYLLTGTPDYRFLGDAGDYQTYNAAFFFRPDSVGFEYYYKMALVPAAESMPFKKTFPFLRKLNVGGGDFFPGKEFTVFRFKIPRRIGRFDGREYRIGRVEADRRVRVGLSAVICYESVFPDIVRGFVKNGANLLTIITNDGWFGRTSGPYQHARYAVFRAIENRVSIVRCANTGISSFIDPTGRILQHAPLNTRGELVGYLPLNTEHTYFTARGDWFGKLILLVSLLLIFIKLVFWMVAEKAKEPND